MLRRFAAMFYDSFLLIALLFILTVPIVIINGGAIRADGSLINELKRWAFMGYLLFGACCFYTWFWTHGGQTLGMSAWRIRVVDLAEQPITWHAAFIRAMSACLGLANLTAYLSKDRRGWHEKLSHSQTVYLPKANSA